MASLRLKRAELWSDLECVAGSRRLAALPGMLAAAEEREVGEIHTLDLTVPYDAALWLLLDQADDQVIRTILESGTVAEWRIRVPTDERTEAGELTRELRCESILGDLLNNSGFLVFAQADGRALLHNELIQLTPAEQMGAVFATGVVPSYVALGTVEPTDRIDMIYDWDTPWSAMKEIATLSRGELELERNGAAGYIVHLRNEVNAALAAVRVRLGKNQLQIRRERDSRENPNRIYPRGAGDAGYKADIGDTRWEVASVDQAGLPSDEYRITFGAAVSAYTALPQEPVWADGELVGTYLYCHHRQDAVAGGPLSPTLEVVASTAPNEVIVQGSMDTANPLDYAIFRADAAGNQLVYLDSIADGAGSEPIRAMLLDRQDVPAINNLALNPFAEKWDDPNWYAGLPSQWLALDADDGSAPAISEYTGSLYRRYGSSSAHVVAAAGGGILTPSTLVYPDPNRPNYSCQVRLWVISGTVQVRLRTTQAAGEVYYPDASQPATTELVGAWTEILGIDPETVNFYDLRSGGGTVEFNTEFGLRQVTFYGGWVNFVTEILAFGGDAEFYVDAYHIGNNPGGAPTYVKGSYGQVLWRAAATAITEGETSGPSERLETSLIDLYRLDPSAWPYERLEEGVTVSLEDPAVGTVARRIQRIKRDLLSEGLTEIEFAA